MTVKDLIEFLQKIEQDRIVVLSKDPEGNYYSPLESFALMTYHDNEVHLESLTEELKRQGYTEEDVQPGEKAVVLWP